MCYCHLTPYDRYLIWVGVSLNKSISAIARLTGKHRSTIYREIKRNFDSTRSAYLYYDAQKLYLARRKNAGLKKCKVTGHIQTYVLNKLNKRWSPEQIAGRAKLESRFSICHETIYRFLYRDKLNGGCLWRSLRRSKPYRSKRFGIFRRSAPMDNFARIDQRPEAANERTRLGDVERDLIVSGLESTEALLTIIDRKSRFIHIEKVKSRHASETHKATVKALKNEKKIHTITNDNGSEFGEFLQTEQLLNTKVYFTRPYASWERGSIENANGLIREFFKKGTNFKEVTNAETKQVERLLNSRPRKNLGFRTPKEVHCGQSS